MTNKLIHLRRPSRVARGTLAPLFLAAGLAFAAATAGGCARIGVQPWERDLLSETSMRIGGEGVDVMLDDHIYFSKEASSGGRGVGGGGCGCN